MIEHRSITSQKIAHLFAVFLFLSLTINDTIKRENGILVSRVQRHKVLLIIEIKRSVFLLNKVAESINCLSDFCGQRDLNALTKKELQQKSGLAKLDVAVLFGGSVLSGGDLLAEAMKNDLAHHYIIVGGYGHTSSFLFESAEKVLPGLTKGITSEAALFQQYLNVKYHLRADYLETASTNCGNNITNLLALLKEQKIATGSILMIQEAAMQLRMEATLKKYASDDLLILNYAATQVSVSVKHEVLRFDQVLPSFWGMDQYIRLLMGEIPRLHDTAEGYGPKGQQFIAHVEVPEEVLQAYAILKQYFPHSTRVGNPAYASK